VLVFVTAISFVTTAGNFVSQVMTPVSHSFCQSADGREVSAIIYQVYDWLATGTPNISNDAVVHSLTVYFSYVDLSDAPYLRFNAPIGNLR